MSTYTVRVERQDRDDDEWNLEVPDDVVEDDRTAQELSDAIALLQTVADGRLWRVRVWEGDTATETPTAEAYSRRTM